MTTVTVPVETATHNQMGWTKPDYHKTITDELKQFVKCVHQNHSRLVALCEMSAIDGYALDSESCQKLPSGVLSEVLHDFVDLLLHSQFKFNGKKEDWSIGFLGSRWLDMKAENYDVDYIRAAFYSKKTYKGEWNSDKPYRIQLTVEKGR